MKVPVRVPTWGVAWFMTPEWRSGAGGDEYGTPYAESAYGHGEWAVRRVFRRVAW
ncbi:hypothetical protein GCM10020367_49650 [Streptomyces sannanensis]|uniref:Uncharacterized protein n=1 Tax=Streptomyces sannanensis TaxID=285536 RepID=A0ABP6SHV1_9ACTN